MSSTAERRGFSRVINDHRTVTVLLPAYNEAENLPHVLQEISDVLGQRFAEVQTNRFP